ncbi:MAG: hypothetical protein Q9195_006185 [Heterodermia aff. obscurata]
MSGLILTAFYGAIAKYTGNDEDNATRQLILKAAQWCISLLKEGRFLKQQERATQCYKALDPAVKTFEPDQALRKYASGIFLNQAVISSELLNASISQDPILGLPSTFVVDGESINFGPNLVIRRASETYCRLAGIPSRPIRVYAKLDKARSTKIAQLYEEVKPTPTEPTTQAAYRALCVETLAQWEVIKATGLRVEYEQPQQPAYPNPRKAILDLLHNNHLFVTPTRSAFGDTPFEQDPHNPLLTETSEIISGRRALVNDIFRVVHDYFGHAKEGLGFRAEGEENAWRGHAVMYSPLARRAMTTELRGQNSWINFGPHGVNNRKAGMGETKFADQKLALLPEWCSLEGVDDP